MSRALPRRSEIRTARATDLRGACRMVVDCTVAADRLGEALDDALLGGTGDVGESSDG